ncbi:MAG TPA: hypothetical protein VFM46_13430, partial [Pseudomonadales bacterium]|nr:hypothetical protein [Pseudomonadales bacterium]
MTTALDIISGALRKIGAYQAGDSIDVDDANDALVVLNDLMDSWSNEHLAIFNNVESTFTLQAGVQSYTIGNPSGGTFLGTTLNNSPTISGVTVPANIKAGGSVTGPNIPAGAKVLSFNSGAGTVTLTANATATNAILTPFSYTVPGDVPITRPLRITNAYTRLATSGYSSLDYPCEEISGDQYTSIGLKNQPGPWPKVFYYNTDFPYATIYFWPVPTMNGVF